MKTKKVFVTDIDYCVEEEDVVDYVVDLLDIEEDSEEFYDAIQREIKDVKDSLPKEMTLEIECSEDDDLDELIANEISNDIGWLVNTFNYEIIK